VRLIRKIVSIRQDNTKQDRIIFEKWRYIFYILLMQMQMNIKTIGKCKFMPSKTHVKNLFIEIYVSKVMH